jgi:hypothetical protein
VIAAHDRGGDVGNPVRDAVVAPEHAAVGDVDAEGALPGEDDRLADAAKLVEHGRGIPGAIGFRFPDQFAVGLVQRHHRRSGASRAHDDAVADDQGRLAEPPGNVLPAEIADDIHRPRHFSGGRLERCQVTAGAERIHPCAVDRGRASGTIAPVVREALAVRCVPHALPARDVERNHVLAVLARAERVQPAPGHGERRIALPCTSGLPRQRRAALRPCLEQPAFGRHAVAPGTAPLRPVVQSLNRDRCACKERGEPREESETTDHDVLPILFRFTRAAWCRTEGGAASRPIESARRSGSPGSCRADRNSRGSAG